MLAKLSVHVSMVGETAYPVVRNKLIHQNVHDMTNSQNRLENRLENELDLFH